MKALLLFGALFLATGLLAQAQRVAALVSPELAGSRVTFRLRAPLAKEVAMRGQWTKDVINMTRDDEGVWSATVDPAPAGIWEYSFGVDGLNVLDPSNPALKPQRQPGKSILHIPSTPPAAWDWQDVPHGTVHQHSYLSKAQAGPRELSVYTPPGYERETARKYPLLVLQHGSGDNQRTWVEHGKAHWILDNLIAAGRAQPMVVVMLNGHPTRIPPPEDTEGRAAMATAFPRELFEDALPLVESLYRVETDAAQRAITGLSMGASQSLTVGLGNPGRFAWVGSFSGGGVSPEASERFLSNPEAVNASLRLLWIACGQDDRGRQRNEEFDAALTAKGIHHEWHLTEGEHAWPVWRGHLIEFLPRLFVK